MNNVRKKLGYHVLTGKDIAFVTRDGKFQRLEKGPKEILVVPRVEKIAFILDITPDAMKYTADEIQTQEGLTVTVETQLEFYFDPTQLPASEQPKFAKRLQDPNERRAMLRNTITLVLQAVLSKYGCADACTRGKMFEVIQGEFFAKLKEKLKEYGLFILGERSSVQKIIPPEIVQQRLAQNAERKMYAQMLSEMSEEERNIILRAEMLDALKALNGAMPNISFPDLGLPKPSLPKPSTPANLPADNPEPTSAPPLPPAQNTSSLTPKQPKAKVIVIRPRVVEQKIEPLPDLDNDPSMLE